MAAAGAGVGASVRDIFELVVVAVVRHFEVAVGERAAAGFSRRTGRRGLDFARAVLARRARRQTVRVVWEIQVIGRAADAQQRRVVCVSLQSKNRVVTISPSHLSSVMV